MAQDWEAGGVPASIRQDGWWLHDDPAPLPDTDRRAVAPGWRAGALAALVVLGDALFYGRTPGLSLAIFAAAVFGVATLPVGRVKAGPWVLLGLSVLPVIDHVQPLSVAFLGLGLLTALAAAHLGSGRSDQLAGAVASLVRMLPGRGLRDGLALAANLRRRPGAGAVRGHLWRDWAFPVGGALVLISLLARANPILGDALADLANLPVDPTDTVLRGAFWVGMALLIWPLLMADQAQSLLLRLPDWPLRAGLTPNAVAHALIAFNAILGLQTLLDAAYLWSGASLPSGMTLAEYAHRGAYPLLATALLAGAFALAARPYLNERRGLRPLLLLWIAQNVLLALSAVYRLDLYVESFGLTYLRVYAGIWMLLVAAGLALVLGQVAAGKSSLWLMLRCAALGLGTLYLCAFVNFAAVIARFNVAEGKIDTAYLCSLGPTAAAEIPPGMQATCCRYIVTYTDCGLQPPHIDGWRDWGYRNWRVLRYLERQSQPEAAHGNSRRG